MTAMATFPTYQDKGNHWAEQLLQNPRELWGSWFKPALPAGALVATGSSLLDQALPNAGWPVGVVEVSRVNGQKNVLSVFSAAIATLCAKGQQTLFVSPEETPYQQALVPELAYIENLLSIYPKSINDTLWALENALQNTKTGLVFFWLPAEQESRFASSLRRLKQAAQSGHSTLVVIRQASAQEDLPLTQLHIALRPLAGRSVNVEILKARGQLCHGRNVIMRVQ